MRCAFCEKECKNKNSLSNHQRLCRGNPNRQESNWRFVKEPWNKGLTRQSDPRVDENSKKVSLAIKGKPSKVVWTEEMRKQRSEWRKKLHLDFPETHPNRKLAGNRNKMSYPESVAFDFLTGLGVKFSHNQKIDKYYPDFIIDKVIIEIDGERWHDEERDSARDAKLCELGFKVYRIKSKENICDRIRSILSVV